MEDIKPKAEIDELNKSSEESDEIVCEDQDDQEIQQDDNRNRAPHPRAIRQQS